MTTYGITLTGFVRKHLTEIIAELESALTDAFGKGIRLDAKSVFGKLVGCFSQPLGEAWEMAEAVFNAFYPNTAVGAALDGCLELVGLSRQPATRSLVDEILVGDVGSAISIGTVIATTQDPTSSTSTVRQFRTRTAVTLNTTDAAFATIEPAEPSVGGGDVYDVTINGHLYSYTSAPGDTKAIVASELALLIGAGADPVTSWAMGRLLLVIGFVAYPSVVPTAAATPFTLVLSATISPVSVGVSVPMEAVDLGAVRAAPLSITDIKTPATGFRSAFNPASAVTGRERETDAEARQRRASSLAYPGAGTQDAIVAKLGQVSGVTNATVYTNRTDATDSDGFLPHSVAAVVVGGEDDAIAEALWKAVAACDAMNGSTTVLVTDAQGFSQPVKFYRPAERLMWLRVIYYRNLEESFPSNHDDLIKVAVAEFGGTLQPGADVMPDRFKGSIHAACSGISRTIIEVALDATGSPGAYQLLPFAIGKLQWAKFSTDRVQVVAG